MATADDVDALSVECRERATAVPAPPAQAPGWAPDRVPDRAAQWPLRSYLELGALPTAAGCARLHARQLLGEWGLRELAETIELVVSELATNSVRASGALTVSQYGERRTPGVLPVRLWLSSDTTSVLVRIWDGSDAMPERKVADPAAESGRGLLLVEALSADWGAYVPDGWGGKIVWCLVTNPLVD